MVLGNKHDMQPVSIDDIMSMFRDEFARAQESHHDGSYAKFDTLLDDFFDAFPFYNFETVIDQLERRAMKERLVIGDFGCGHAYTLQRLVSRLESVAGVPQRGIGLSADLSHVDITVMSAGVPTRVTHFDDNQQSYSTRNGGGLDFYIHDIHVPFAKFDAIFSATTFMHLAAPWIGFQSVCDQLTVGGFAVINHAKLYASFPRKTKAQFEKEFDDLKQRNPAYDIVFAEITVDEYNPLVRKIMVHKTADAPFDLPFSLGTTINRTNLYPVLTRDKAFISCNDVFEHVKGLAGDYRAKEASARNL